MTSSALAPVDEVERLALLLPAGVRLAAMLPDEAQEGLLHPAERTNLSARADRASQFVGGRMAARAALAMLGAAGEPVRVGAGGEPVWPRGIVGSIAHKPGLCVAVVARGRVGLGVDVEPTAPLPRAAVRLVLTARERATHLGAGGDLDPRVSRLGLCAKEATYKWWCSRGEDPGRLDWHDLEVDAADHGCLPVRLPVGLRVRLRDDRVVDPPRLAAVVGARWTLAVAWSDSSRPAHRRDQVG